MKSLCVDQTSDSACDVILGHTRFVEGDVTVLTDTGKEEFDTAIRFDGSLVCVAFSDEVGCVAVKDVYLGGGNVDLGAR